MTDHVENLQTYNFNTANPILIINQFNNLVNTVSIQLDQYKKLNNYVKYLRVFLVLMPNILVTTNQHLDKHILVNIYIIINIIFILKKLSFFIIHLY